MAAAAAFRLPARRAFLGAFILGLALVGVTAILYATSTGTSWLADRAEKLAIVDEMLTESEVAQLHLAQTLLLGTDLPAGLTTPEIVTASAEAATLAMERLESRVLEYGDSDLTAVAGTYRGRATEMLDRIAAGELDAARVVAAGEVSTSHDRLSRQLAEVRGGVIADVAKARSVSGVVAIVTGVMLILVIPVVVVIVYRAMARRQLRRAELEAKLTAAHELSRAKDEFIANISHELRTPLTGIYGFAQVLEEGSLFDPETALELLNLIITQAGELGRMVDDLLTAARANAEVLSFEIAPIQVEPQVAEVVPAFERVDGPISTFIEHVPVMADPVRLRQIVRNLIANARKHGGPSVQVIGQQVGDHYELAVVDDGPGVPDQLLGTMFERFMHAGDTPLVSGSVGLGLNIARTLARGMGGDIEYKRKDGFTQFVTILQLAPVQAEWDSHPEVIHV